MSWSTTLESAYTGQTLICKDQQNSVHGLKVLWVQMGKDKAEGKSKMRFWKQRGLYINRGDNKASKHHHCFYLPVLSQSTLLELCYAKWDPKTRSISLIWKFARNAKSRKVPQIYWTRIFILMRSRGDSYAHPSLRRSDWGCRVVKQLGQPSLPRSAPSVPTRSCTVVLKAIQSSI